MAVARVPWEDISLAELCVASREDCHSAHNVWCLSGRSFASLVISGTPQPLPSTLPHFPQRKLEFQPQSAGIIKGNPWRVALVRQCQMIPKGVAVQFSLRKELILLVVSGAFNYIQSPGTLEVPPQEHHLTKLLALSCEVIPPVDFPVLPG